MNLPFVSVIIPVFNDAVRLKLCLAALENQTYDQNNYEVIVVDNDSDDNHSILGIIAQFPQVKMTTELYPSSYAARNKGIQIAKGSIIAFTDADCIPANDWLERGVNHFQSIPNCGMLIGCIEIFFQDPNHLTLIERYQNITAFRQKYYLKKFHSGATANLLTSKDVIDRVGLFNSKLKSFGDFEWGNKVFLAGYQQFYVEDMIVKHPSISLWKELKKKTLRVAGGVYDHFIDKQKSWHQKNMMFVRLIIGDLIVGIIFTINTFMNPNVKGVKQKFEVSLVHFVVQYISASEKIRLRFGGVSRRD
jgi:glycosyltransferase involved in cell wall biosynthesis